jgi:hypothetical protein
MERNGRTQNHQLIFFFLNKGRQCSSVFMQRRDEVNDSALNIENWATDRRIQLYPHTWQLFKNVKIKWRRLRRWYLKGFPS